MIVVALGEEMARVSIITGCVDTDFLRKLGDKQRELLPKLSRVLVPVTRSGRSSVSETHTEGTGIPLPVDVNHHRHASAVDCTFVRGSHHDTDKHAIVATNAALANQFGLALTAEGVETADELAALLALGCRSAQGYYWAAPELTDPFTGQ